LHPFAPPTPDKLLYFVRGRTYSRTALFASGRSCARFPSMNREREFHKDANGDRWCLISTYGELVVRWERFVPERVIEHISLGRFLGSHFGPEQQKLLHLIGTLLDPPQRNRAVGGLSRTRAPSQEQTPRRGAELPTRPRLPTQACATEAG
jgi:hypothetical protein